MTAGEWRRLLIVVVPAALAVAIVSVLLGVALVPGSAGEGPSRGAPHIGRDHWHATYQIFICGELQPDLPPWEGGVHTHGDGIIHIHPFVPSEEGEGARLVKFFAYGGGTLSQSEMRLPGDRHIYANDDQCPDGSNGVLQVFVNGEQLDDWSDYIPRDGDLIDIVFGPRGEGPLLRAPKSSATGNR